MGNRSSAAAHEEEEEEEDSDEESEPTEDIGPAPILIEESAPARAAPKSKKAPVAAPGSAAAKALLAAKAKAKGGAKAKATSAKPASADAVDSLDLLAKVKAAIQSAPDTWKTYCGAYGSGEVDPQLHDTAFLQRFLQVVKDDTPLWKLSGQVTSSAAPSNENQSELPRGHYGAIWEALEDSIMRKDIDWKSPKVGDSVQAGERCTQLCAWKGDGTGRVRVQVKSSRGVTGWVTLDATRCRLQDGSYGTRAFKLLQKEDLQQANSESENQDVAEEGEDDEAEDDDDDVEELLWGTSKASNKGRSSATAKPKPKPAAKSVAAAAKSVAPKAVPAEVAEEVAPETTEENVATKTTKATPSKEAAAAKAKPLTDAEKELRNCQKKLRDVEALQKRVDDQLPLTPEQQAKLGRIDDLRQQVTLAQAAVAAEQASKKKKSSAQKKKAKGKKKDDGAGTERAGTSCGTILMLAAIPGVAIAAWWFNVGH